MYSRLSTMDNETLPPIQSFDDLMTEDQLCEFLDVKKTALTGWRYGRDGRVELPFIKLATKRWYSKTQVIWWMNQWQLATIEKYRRDRQKRLKEGIVVGRAFAKRPTG